MVADGFITESSAIFIYAKRLVCEMPRKGDCVLPIFAVPLHSTL